MKRKRKETTGTSQLFDFYAVMKKHTPKRKREKTGFTLDDMIDIFVMMGKSKHSR